MEFPLLGQAVSIELANTLWVYAGRTTDALDRAEVAGRWLVAITDRMTLDGSRIADLGALTVDEALRERLVLTRSAVRAVFGAVARRTQPDPTHLDLLQSTSRAAPSWLEPALAPGAAVVHRRRDGTPGAVLLAMLADDALSLFGTPADAARLLDCPGPGCRGLFLQDDGRRKFCSPGCGTRARVARHYARTKTVNSSPAELP